MKNITTNIKFSPVDMEARKALNFKAGDTITVWSKILEEKPEKKGDKKGDAKKPQADKFRLQAFEGIVLGRKHGTEMGATFTVRKIASGVGVERIFPLYSPMVDKIEIVKRANAHRSKLYYVRTKAVKDVRKRMRSSVVHNEAIKDDIETLKEVAE